MDFAEWLRGQIHARPDLKQVRLAEQLGVYASTVSFWLKGKTLPDDENLAKLAEIFGVDVSTLYRIVGKLPPAEVNGITLNADEIEIVRDLEELRGSRTYPALIVAMKALLAVAQQEEDSPQGG